MVHSLGMLGYLISHLWSRNGPPALSARSPPNREAQNSEREVPPWALLTCCMRAYALRL